MVKAMKIKILEWKETRINGQEIKVVKVKTPELIRTLIQITPVSLLPTGLKTFGFMKDLHHALKASKNEEELILEKATYQWIKKNVFPLIPASWGLNPDLAVALDEIINAEEFELNPEKT